MSTQRNTQNNTGFVTTVILIVIALIALKYALHFDLVEYLKSPAPQKIIIAIWTWIKSVYTWFDKFIGNIIHKK